MPLGEAMSPDPFAAVGEGVVKQRCGTCRFFDEEGGFAGSGWCRHPQRNPTGAILMVRRDELACRNGWDQSLWECASESEVPSPIDAVLRNGHRPVAPIDSESVRALVLASTTEEHQGEDVLLSEARIVSEPYERLNPPTTQPMAGFDPRTALFRAREAHKARARAKAVAERRAAGLEPAGPAAASAAVDQSASLEPSFDESQAQMVHQVPVVARNRHHASAHGKAEVGLERVGDLDPGLVGAQQVIVPEPAFATLLDSSEVCVPDDTPAFAPNTGVRPERVLAELPSWFRTDLPRVCRSCRDFRPSADGQRGWCANAWAFTHSRLVQADEPTPCQSAIGDWWVPVDDVWLVAADVSGHGRATPLLDRALAAEPAKRRRS